MRITMHELQEMKKRGEHFAMLTAYDYSTAKLLDAEIARILHSQEQRAFDLLTKHRRGLDLIAEALLEHETIDGPRVAELLQQGLIDEGSTESIDANVLGIPE